MQSSIGNASDRRAARLRRAALLLGLCGSLAAPGCGDSARPNAATARFDLSAPSSASPGTSPSPNPARPPRTSESRPSPRSLQAGTIRFRDATDAAGIGFVHRSGNGPDKSYPTANGSGIALIDYDGDGRLDLYFASTRELPLDRPSDAMGNRLYRNKGDGTFEDVTERAKVGYRGFSGGVAVGDVDDDGHPDLFLANLGGNVLYLNNGDGTFRIARDFGAECDRWCTGAAFFDYDRDGDLDLYVTTYGVWDEATAKLWCGSEAVGVRTYCSPLRIAPDRHFLFRNKGDGTFEDVTESAGILRRDGRGLGIVAADLDLDGWIDLYVANDLCPHFVFRNKGDGTFEDVTEWSGAGLSEAGHAQAGMGVDAEDVDGDGRPELFATHFREDYNTLYRNLGGWLFQDVTSWAGVLSDSLPNVGWGCALADFDNDGWPDILVVNGHVDDNLALLHQDVPQAEPPRVWRNRGDGRFGLVPDAGPFFETGHVARGAAFGDLDDDGDLDVVVGRLDAKPAILWNESPPRAWVRLDLRAGRVGAGRSAIGAVVAVHVGDRVLTRQLKGGGSYLSANDPRLLIGLGAAERVDRIDIQWPSGARSTLGEPSLRTTHLLREPPPADPAGSE